MDLAGIVEHVGLGVTDFAPGDEVWAMAGGIAGVQGSMAEFAAVDCRLRAKKPTSLSIRYLQSIGAMAIDRNTSVEVCIKKFTDGLGFVIVSGWDD